MNSFMPYTKFSVINAQFDEMIVNIGIITNATASQLRDFRQCIIDKSMHSATDTALAVANDAYVRLQRGESLNSIIDSL